MGRVQRHWRSLKRAYSGIAIHLLSEGKHTGYTLFAFFSSPVLFFSGPVEFIAVHYVLFPSQYALVFHFADLLPTAALYLPFSPSPPFPKNQGSPKVPNIAPKARPALLLAPGLAGYASPSSASSCPPEHQGILLRTFGQASSFFRPGQTHGPSRSVICELCVHPAEFLRPLEGRVQFSHFMSLYP